MLRLAGLAAATAVVGACDTAPPPTAPQPRPTTTVATRVAPPPRGLAISGDAPRALYGPDTARGDMDERVVNISDDRPSGLLDAEAMVRAGLAYHLAKATRDYKDTPDYPCKEPNFSESRKRANGAGLLFGGYHFMNAGNGEHQADAYCERIDETGGLEGIIHIVDYERYSLGKGKADIAASYDDLMAFIDRHQANTNNHPLVIYTSTEEWNNLAATNNNVVPLMPKNTFLWWVRLMRTPSKGQFEGPASLLDTFVSRPQDPDDPWRSEGFGRIAPGIHDAEDPLYPFFRQITFRGHLQQFDGSDRKVIYNPDAYNKRVLDMNVSFRPFSQLLALAGLAPGSLPEPQPLQA